MNENGGSFEENVDRESGAINRRRVLKGAVAAGVGAAVWTAPNIRTLGSTPAYATHTATTQIPTSILQSDTLNATCSDSACPNSASWGPSGGTAGVVRITPTREQRVLFGLAANDRFLVNVTGCTGLVGRATASDLTLQGVSLKSLGYCIQVFEIFTSNSGNVVSNYVPKSATGVCDPKSFQPTAYPGSCGLFLRATILITDYTPGGTGCCN